MNIIKRHGIPRRTTQSYTVIYITDENFFDTIDSEEKSYVLGFLYADGNNYVREVHSYEITCQLQLDDKCILEKIRNLISFNSPITKVFDKSTSKFYYRLRINNKK